MKKYIANILKVIIPLSLGFLLISWLYKDYSLSDISAILKGEVNWSWIFLVVILCVLGHITRALRWRMLLDPLKNNISLLTVTNAVFLNYGVNLLLPRMGEFSRCVAISKKENLPFSTLLGTLLAERIIDMITVLMIVLIALFLQIDYFATNFTTYDHLITPFKAIFLSPWFYFGSGTIVLLLIVVYYKNRDHFLVHKAKEFLRQLWNGIVTISHLKQKGLFIFYSLFLWFLYLLQLYFCFFAFGFTSHLSFASSIVMFAMGSLAYALPVQGAIGPWHFAIILSMTFYGVSKEQASVFALLAHAIPNIVIIFCGLYASYFFYKKKGTRLINA